MPGANQMGVRLDTAGPEIKRFRPLRGLRVLLGSALVLVGVLLFVPLLTVIILTGVLALSGSDVEATDVETVLILAGLTIGAIVVWTVGVKLIRGRTQTVLFLRKFGFADAKDFISHAAAQGLGRHWRLVTLDDLETSPVGSGRSVRWTLRFGRFLVLGLLVWLLWRLFIFSTDGVDSLIDDATDQAVSDAENAFEGFFVAVVMAFVVAIAAALVVAFFAVLVATVGAIGVFAFVSNRSLRRAERDKWTPVHDSQQLSDFIERTVKQRSRLFAPALPLCEWSTSCGRKPSVILPTSLTQCSSTSPIRPRACYGRCACWASAPTSTSSSSDRAPASSRWRLGLTTSIGNCSDFSPIARYSSTNRTGAPSHRLCGAPLKRRSNRPGRPATTNRPLPVVSGGLARNGLFAGDVLSPAKSRIRAQSCRQVLDGLLVTNHGAGYVELAGVGVAVQLFGDDD